MAYDVRPVKWLSHLQNNSACDFAASNIRRFVTVAHHTKALLIALAATTLSGCSSTYFYRQADDLLAQKAQKAYVDANLKGALASERTAIAEFANQEIDAVKRDQISIRDAKLLAILSGTEKKHTWDALRNDIDERYVELLQAKNDTAVKIETQLRQIDETKAHIEVQKNIYLLASKGKVKLKCPIPASQVPKSNEVELIPAFNLFQQSCTNSLEAKKTLKSLVAGKGRLGTLVTELENIERDQAALSSSLDEAKAAYESALKATKTESQSGKVESLAKNLKEKLDKLDIVSKADAIAKNKILSGLLDELPLKFRLPQVT